MRFMNFNTPKMPQKPAIDSARPEFFSPLVPHRLPLPPLLASQPPAMGQSSAARPQPRIQMLLHPSLTAVEQPLLQSTPKDNAPPHPQAFALQNPDKINELKMLQITCARSQRPLAEALAYWNMAIEYENSGNHLLALTFFENFIRPCQRAGYSPGVLTGLSSVAVSYFMQQKYQECINTNEQALKLTAEALETAQKTSGGWLSASYVAASLLYNTGLAFLELFDYEGATLAFSRALQHVMQISSPEAEAAVNAGQAVCNALSGDFAKVDSCVDRFAELLGIEESGLETTLGLKSVKLVQQESVVLQGAQKQQSQGQILVSVLLKIANLARFHSDLERSKHYALRAFNVGRALQLSELVAVAACAIGITVDIEPEQVVEWAILGEDETCIALDNVQW